MPGELERLEEYIRNLHMVLEFTVHRVRRLEAIVGRDVYTIEQSDEWRATLEHIFRNLLTEHNQFWQSDTDETRKRLGDIHYRKIIQVAEMLPTDVAFSIFSEFNYPEGVPLVFSEKVKGPPRQKIDHTGKSDKDLRKEYKNDLE